MKKIIIFLFMILSAWQSMSSDLQVYYYYSPFYNTEVGNYIETYTTVVGNSAVFKKNENGKYQAVVEVTMLFNQEGTVKEFRKFNLKSPEITDTLSKPNFIDLQRINLKEGNYNFELKIKDLQSLSSKEYVFHDIIIISHKTDEVVISGVEFLEKYTPTQQENVLSRNGYDMVPYVADFYPSSLKKFTFYFEIYNTKTVLGADKDFLLKYYIENKNLKMPMNNFALAKKQKSKDLFPILGEFSIEGLESGNYNFVIEVVNNENKIIATKKTFFQRSNPINEVEINNIQDEEIQQSFIGVCTNPDSLVEYIRCLYPIWNAVEGGQAENVINADSIIYLQKFIYGFWAKRNLSNPKGEWEKYKAKVDYVNHKYGMQIKKGYQTDMGRVYLQYGAPNNIQSEPFSGETYPYEIWHYWWASYSMKDVKFVFLNSGSTGKEYLLIHSTAKGEFYEDLWYMKLYNGNKTFPYFYTTRDLQKELDKEDWYSRVMSNYNK
jgi:GWxTD domain-containing protein